jgi:aconitate hydratase
MGVLPLQFAEEESVASLGLSGTETFDFSDLEEGRAKRVEVIARSDDGGEKRFEATVRLDTPNEIDYFINGGILQAVLRKLKE